MSQQPSARKEIGNRIKRLRSSRDISLQKLAGEAGFSAGYLSEVERGNSSLSSEKLASLARIFGVSTDYLLTGEERRTATEEPEIKVPKALHEVAVRHDLRHEQTVRLLAGYSSLIARRTRNPNEPRSEWSVEDWEAFYESVKNWL